MFLRKDIIAGIIHARYIFHCEQLLKTQTQLLRSSLLTNLLLHSQIDFEEFFYINSNLPNSQSTIFTCARWEIRKTEGSGAWKHLSLTEV